MFVRNACLMSPLQHTNLDTTRRLPLLERSSQLKDSFEDFESPKRVIVYNPLKDARRKKPAKRRERAKKTGNVASASGTSSSGNDEVRAGSSCLHVSCYKTLSLSLSSPLPLNSATAKRSGICSEVLCILVLLLTGYSLYFSYLNP